MSGAVRPIVQAGDPVLRAAARALAPGEIGGAALRALIADLRETMRAAPGVGLAAPQVGEPLQLAVIEDRAAMAPDQLRALERVAVPFHVLINPRLTPIGDETVAHFEACLSVAGYRARVARARRVRVEALDERGRPVTIEASGWYARILQHEWDHLQGTLYVDRMDPRTFSTHENWQRFSDG